MTEVLGLLHQGCGGFIRTEYDDPEKFGECEHCHEEIFDLDQIGLVRGRDREDYANQLLRLQPWTQREEC